MYADVVQLHRDGADGIFLFQISSGKPVVIYMAPSKSFRTIKSAAQLDSLLSDVPSEIRSRIDRYLTEHASPRLF